MASEPPERHRISVTLPPSLDEWLSERADSAGIDREELLAQLAVTYRAAAEDSGTASELVNAVEAAATDAATDRVDNRLGSFRSSLDSQLQAIRKRLVQLKQETDEKAEASRVDDVEESLTGIESSIETIHEEIEGLSAATDETGAATGPPTDGTDEVSADPELIDRLEDVESKLVRVARAVVELRDVDSVASPYDTTLRELKRVAAREGVREATCAGCGEPVDLALLGDCACPHCEGRFAALTVDGVPDGPRLTIEGARESDDGNENTASGATNRTGQTNAGGSNVAGKADER